VTNQTGSPILSLACGGLYIGGGGNAVPLPITVPDQGSTVTSITDCDPVTGALTLSGASAAETGSNRNCSTAGCFFGPPLPIPNAMTPPTSTCVINTVAVDASGTASCDDGSQSLDLPLNSQVFLTGDTLLAEPGIQPCPLCPDSGPNAFACLGGANDGLPCTPGSSDLGNSYPTSHDCPPFISLDVGTLPIAFALTTGTAAATAVTLGNQEGVFCGFCRDVTAGGSHCFEGDSSVACPPGSTPVHTARPCDSSADCPDPDYPDCQQRDSGAFSRGAARGISTTGSPAGACLADGTPHASTLVSLFCIPPTFEPTVDTTGNLPGPGAVSLPGTVGVLF
jgi:hypothetical protein